MNIILGRQTWNMHACGYICDHVCASAAHYSHSFLQTSFSPFSLPQKNSDTHCLFHFHCLCRTNKPPPLPPPPPPPHTHTHTPPPAKTHTFLWRCFSLIVIQQHHQLLGLVYETPVQLATKHTVCIAFHSGHWYLRFFFFLVALSWMKVASVYISSRQWRAGPPPTTTTITTTKLWGQFQCSDRHSTCSAFTVPCSKWWIKFNENVLLTSCELEWNPEVLGLLPVRGEFRDRWVVGGLKACFCNTWFEVLTIKEKKHNGKDPTLSNLVSQNSVK